MCIRMGGTISGEHGVGIEKRPMMRELFTPDDLAVMERARAAFDPGRRLNPGKILPGLDDGIRGPAQLGGMQRRRRERGTLDMSATLGLHAERGVDPARYALGGLAPRWALRPSSVDEAVEALRAAARDRLRVLPWAAAPGSARRWRPAGTTWRSTSRGSIASWNTSPKTSRSSRNAARRSGRSARRSPRAARSCRWNRRRPRAPRWVARSP